MDQDTEESKGDYIFDLARIHIELDDVNLSTKLLTACVFALAAMDGVPPGQFLVNIAGNLPGMDEWYEKFLPHLMEFDDEDNDDDEESEA